MSTPRGLRGVAQVFWGEKVTDRPLKGEERNRMRRSKRTLQLLSVALTLVLVAAACGDDTDEGGGGNDATTDDPEAETVVQAVTAEIMNRLKG